LKIFVDAALELMKAGLSSLPIERMLYVEQAQKLGADVGIVFFPGAGNVTVALHFPDPSTEPATLFQIVVPFPEVSTN
jgi:hypothetical protein